MRLVTIVWIREIKLAKIIFLCLILKFEEIFPKNRKLSPKDKIISPKNRKLSPKDKMISPKENCLLIIYPGTDCCRWFSVACRTEFWMWFLGGEGEGCIFNLYIIFFFFRVFPIFDPRVFFGFYPNPSRVYIKKSFQTFTLHLFGDSFDDQRVTGEGWWRHFFAFFKYFFAFGHSKESLVGKGEIWTCLGKEKGDYKKAR